MALELSGKNPDLEPGQRVWDKLPGIFITDLYRMKSWGDFWSYGRPSGIKVLILRTLGRNKHGM